MMKQQNNQMKGLVWLLVAAVCVPCMLSWAATSSWRAPLGVAAVDTVVQQDGDDDLLPGTYPVGTLSRDSVDDSIEDLYVYIKAVGRTYGDSIVLRWAVESYPEWDRLNRTGYDVLRHTEGEGEFLLDTLATGIRPMSLADFRRCYPDTIDSLAYMAMGAIYGEGDMTPEMTNYEPGSIGSFVELEQDQKTRLIGAFLAAEWRPDLAQAMGLRFVDKTAKKGKTYSYFIMPSVPDTTGRFFIMPAQVENLRNEKYVPAPYDVALTDTILEHGSVGLSWNDAINGTFDVFWRKVGEADWRKVNELPYAPPFRFGQDDPSIFYEHSPGVVGLYEYAVRAYDAFGDLTPLSAPHKVFFPDLMPPLGPEITSIVIDRPGKTLYDEVYATIYFHKDSLEDDFVRYVPLYFNERDSSKQWKLLTNQYIAPGDTMVRIDVTNISTGMITIAAVDTAENMGYAYPKLLRVRDARPPEAPTQVRGLPSLDGTIAILWEMSDTLDVHHYDVFWANSPDDEFTILNRRHVIPRSYTDTVAVDINQRYIYYYVRAVDYATNIGAPSDTIAVLRPSTVPPSRPHLDSAWVDNRMIHTRWIGGSDEMISHYNVYRRRPGAAWMLLRVADGDSVRAHGYALQVDDEPPAPLGQRYEYAVETISLWDISSGLSPAFSGRVNYDKVLPLTPTLFADYDVPSGEVKLAWEMDDKNAGGAEYYYCVYRRRKGQETFRFITDVPQGVHTYTGDLLQPGEWAEYYLTVRFRDGRQGQVSNRVTVAAPANPPSTTEQFMDMKPIRRLTASLLRHRAAPWLCALAVLVLTSCGDFFEFGEERATWDGKIICQNDSSVVMVGDTMTLSVDFSPPRPDSLSVFWSVTSDDSIPPAYVLGDRFIGVSPGTARVMAVLSNAMASASCSVRVIGRWEQPDFNRLHPHDMVIYAHITVRGEEWNPDSMMVGAFIGGQLVGMAVPKTAHDINYALLRIWAKHDTHVGRILLRCYDRRRFRLYSAPQDFEFDTGKTLGTLSKLYDINF